MELLPGEKDGLGQCLPFLLRKVLNKFCCTPGIGRFMPIPPQRLAGTVSGPGAFRRFGVVATSNWGEGCLSRDPNIPLRQGNLNSLFTQAIVDLNADFAAQLNPFAL